MLVMSRQFGAGFLGVTGPLGKRGLAVFPGQRLLYPPIPGNSLLRFKLILLSLKFFGGCSVFDFGGIQVKISELIIYLTRNFSFFLALIVSLK